MREHASPEHKTFTPQLVSTVDHEMAMPNGRSDGHGTIVAAPVTALPPAVAAAPKEGVNFQHPCAGRIRILDHDQALVEELCPDGTPRKKVAIVGYAESSRMLAPFDDPAFSVWGLNQLYRHIPRADRWFEIHHNWDEYVIEGTDHVGWLRDAPIPTYMTQRLAQFPHSLTLPIERLIGLVGKDYFSSTIAYMIALAILEKFTTIHLYGIDLIVGDEWDYQKPNAEFWLGVANGAGISVGIPVQSALCRQTWRYGYQSQPESLIKMSEIQERRAYLSRERQKKMIELANLDGALQDAEMFHELGMLRVRGSNVQFKAPA